MTFVSLSDVVPEEFLGDEVALETRLADAYRQLFSGNGSKEDADIVLVDLIVHARLFQALPTDASAAELRHYDGARGLLLRILEALNMPFDELASLHSAMLKTPVMPDS